MPQSDVEANYGELRNAIKSIEGLAKTVIKSDEEPTIGNSTRKMFGANLEENASKAADATFDAGKTFSDRLMKHTDAIEDTIKALQKSDNEAAQVSEFFRILSIPGMQP